MAAFAAWRARTHHHSAGTDVVDWPRYFRRPGLIDVHPHQRAPVLAREVYDYVGSSSYSAPVQTGRGCRGLEIAGQNFTLGRVVAIEFSIGFFIRTKGRRLQRDAR